MSGGAVGSSARHVGGADGTLTMHGQPQPQQAGPTRLLPGTYLPLGR